MNYVVNITANELEALRGIDASEYGDCITDQVWSWSVTDNCSLAARSVPGVISSLVKKGLVSVNDSGTADACVGMTSLGVAAFVERVGTDRRKWIDDADLVVMRQVWEARRAAKKAEHVAPEALAYLALAGCAA